jgi:hypothetical protein
LTITKSGKVALPEALSEDGTSSPPAAVIAANPRFNFKKFLLFILTSLLGGFAQGGDLVLLCGQSLKVLWE